MDLFLSIDVFGNRMCVCVAREMFFFPLFPLLCLMTFIADDVIIRQRWSASSGLDWCVVAVLADLKTSFTFFSASSSFPFSLSFDMYIYMSTASTRERERRRSGNATEEHSSNRISFFLSLSLSVVLYQKEGDVFGLTLATWSIRLWLC